MYDQAVVDDVIGRFRNDQSGGEIGRALGLTRSQVLGIILRARRKGTDIANTRSLRLQTNRMLGLTGVRKRSLAKKESRVRKAPLPKPLQPVAAEPKVVALPRPVVGGVPIEGIVSRFQCRFILTDEAPHLYCGHRTFGTTSWCAEHREIVYVPQARRKASV